MKRTKKAAWGAVAAMAMLGAVGTSGASAAPPVVEEDEGAYVRLLGNPADGTAKFQFGWSADTPAADAAGYWVGVYDVTRSHYVWSYDTGATDLPENFFRNARPTIELPNGDYKVVLFVRETYGPPAVTNIAEINLEFGVTNSPY